MSLSTSTFTTTTAHNKPSTARCQPAANQEGGGSGIGGIAVEPLERIQKGNCSRLCFNPKSGPPLRVLFLMFCEVDHPQNLFGEFWGDILQN